MAHKEKKQKKAILSLDRNQIQFRSIGFICSRSKKWFLTHLQYISIINPPLKVPFIHCLICQDKKEYTTRNIINHFNHVHSDRK